MNLNTSYPSQLNQPFIPDSRHRTGSFLYLFIFTILLLCYGNSFQAGWHFDDFINILGNQPLHIKDLSPASLKQTFFAYPEYPGKLLRPVSNLSFALNGFVGKSNVFGYHLVNFLIHFFATILLYQSCVLLLSSPRFGSSRYQNSKYQIAAIAALFWALNPIQTQAIIYIVQRMAALAALFYIMGIWCYLKARLTIGSRKRAMAWYAAMLFSFFLAICSKENAVIFPASIVLIELIFFQQEIRCTRKNILILTGGCTLILGSILFLVGPGFFNNIVQSYADRDFTLQQRVLTEARIVVDYLGMLFYPSPARLSLTHDVQLSTSLFSPPTTLAAVLFLVTLTILPFFYFKRYPLLSFAVLFFLLNHIVESTILNLELVFEHRNYLPSLFLFLPIATGIARLQKRFQEKRPLAGFTINFAVIIILVMLGIGTIERNKAWHTEKSLWTDSLEKAPLTARSYINLAHGYLFDDKNYQKAFELNYLSLDKYAPNPWKARLPAYNNMATIMVRINNFEQAMIFYNKALSASAEHPDSPSRSEVIFDKGRLQWITGQDDMALQTLAQLTDAWPYNGTYQQFYGDLLMAADRTDEAIPFLQQTLKFSKMSSPEYQMAILDLSLLYARVGIPQKAKFYGRLAQQIQVPLVPAALCLLENSILLEQPEKAEYAMKKLLSQLTWPAFMAALTTRTPDSPTLPLNYPMLRQYALNWITEQQQQTPLHVH